jgi:hypothetical protein
VRDGQWQREQLCGIVSTPPPLHPIDSRKQDQLVIVFSWDLVRLTFSFQKAIQFLKILPLYFQTLRIILHLLKLQMQLFLSMVLVELPV